jgi:2-phosphoglycerate kinase
MKLDVIIDDTHVIPDYILKMTREERRAKIAELEKEEQKKRLFHEKRSMKRHREILS